MEKNIPSPDSEESKLSDYEILTTPDSGWIRVEDYDLSDTNSSIFQRLQGQRDEYDRQGIKWQVVPLPDRRGVVALFVEKVSLQNSTQTKTRKVLED